MRFVGVDTGNPTRPGWKINGGLPQNVTASLWLLLQEACSSASNPW
jgi:hypothetical protein